MTAWMMILLLTIGQLVAGMGLTALFRIRLMPGMLLALWALCGIMVFSLVPFVLHLCFIPLTAANIFVALLAVCLLLNIRYQDSREQLKQLLREKRFRIRLYEIPFLLVVGIAAIISVWRCFYYPPTPRDLTSGAEVIAEYAVKEKTLVNSVFNVNLETTNNQFKPPFILCLQIIYKYAGFQFGQVWLSTVFISCLVFLYHALCRQLHRLLAGLLLVIFVAIPEMYAYTFMALFDYSNAVFFFLSTFFLIEYFKSRENKLIAFAGLLMGFATYIRSETLILAVFMELGILWHFLRNWKSGWALVKAGLWYILPAAFFYVLSITIYIKLYLPQQYNVSGLVNQDLLNLAPLWKRMKDMNTELFFSKFGIDLFGYSFFIFGLVLAGDLIGAKLNRDSRNWLFAAIIIYAGMPFLGYLLPLLDLTNSTKRGLFKLFPLAIMYMGTSTLLIRLSRKIRQWEEGNQLQAFE